MKTKRFNRKSIVFLFAIAVFFCSVQSLSFGQTAVVIPDANLKAAIQEEIGNEITTETMRNLISFNANNREVKDLTGLEHATNLIQLVLANNSISDISALSKLTQLTSLWIQNNSISDISALSGLTQLKMLLLSHNSISDISALSGLTQLKTLALDQNSISNVSALSGLTQLKTLSLVDNSISDISRLTGLTQLTLLNLQKNPLNAAAINTHIPTIQANGTQVAFDEHAPTTPPQTPPDSTLPPDLVVSNLRISKQTLAPGESFTLFATVENRGGSRAEHGVLNFHESTTNTLNPSDASGFSGGSINPLDPNQQTEMSSSVTAPRQAGTYYYSACAIFVRNELDSSNNCSTWVSITVVAPATAPKGVPSQPNVGTPQPPDLVVSNFRVSKTTLAPGEQFTLFATVENRGTGQSSATPVQFQRTTSDFYTQIGTRNVSALGANRSVEVDFLATAPVQEGIYHYRAYIKIANQHSTWVMISVEAPRTTPVVPTPQQPVVPAPQSNVPPTPQPQVVNTPQPNVVTTPQPNVVSTPQQPVVPTPQPPVASTPQPNVVSTPDPTPRSGAGLIARFKIVGAAERSGATVNEALDSPLLVQVVDLYDDGIPNVRAFFQITAGKGRVTSRGNGRALRVRTDSDGYARTDFTPTAEGTTTVKVSISELDETVEFTIRTGTTPATPTTPPGEVRNPQVNTRIPTGPIDPSQPAIYWGGDGIQRANLDGSNLKTLVKEVYVLELTLDVAGGKMYWIGQDERNNPKIQRANFDGSNLNTLVKPLGSRAHRRSDLVLDVSGGKMYWIDQWFEKGSAVWHKIHRANFDGSNVETLRRGEKGAMSLGLDVSGGKMYWVDWDLAAEDKIHRANLNGSNVQTLVTGKTARDLRLDILSGKMYWMDSGTIRRANLDGSNVETLAGTEGFTEAPIVDALGGKMYWVDWDPAGGNRLQCANLDGSNVQTLVRQEYTYQLTLDVAGGKVYWAGRDGDGYKIQRANLDGSNIEDIVTGYVASFALIPSQTPMNDALIPVVSKKPKVDRQQVHVDATDRPPMYWMDTQAGTLHRLVGAKVENLLPNVRNATSLTLDIANDTLYWTEKTSNKSGKIRSANLDGTNVQLVKNLTSVPLDITLDTGDGKLYLVNSWGKVQRLNGDGSGFQPNLITDLDTPMNIVVDDVANDKLYWTEKSSNTTGRIRSANIDGTNVQLVKDLTSVPLDISLDTFNATLYWTNASGKVQRINVDGSGYQPNFITGLDTSMNIAVDTAGQKLYFTSADGKITRRNLSGGGSEEVVTGLGIPGRLIFGNDDLMATTPATTTPATTDRAEDVNQDGKVDNVDREMVEAALLAIVDGNPPATLGRLDVNGDGELNVMDLVLVLNNFDADEAPAAPTLGIPLTALARDKIQAQIDLLLATDDGSLGVRRALAYLQNLLASARPDETVLLANYPNPFNPETWIPYELSTDSDVRITLYDVKGQVVRRLVLGYQSAGYYTSRSRAAYWDGRNAVGEPVASGLYFYAFTAGDFTATRKMLIRK